MKRLIVGAVWALGLLFAAPALAAPSTPATIGFSIGGDAMTLPVPAGMCLPAPDQTALAQKLAASIPDTVTYVTLFDCSEKAAGGVPARILMVVAPTKLGIQRMDRATVLGSLGSISDKSWANAVNSPEVEAAQRKGAASMAGGEVLKDAKFDATLRPVDRDDLGFYLAGAVTVQVAGVTVTVPLAEAITSVNGHVVMLVAYGHGDGIAAIRTQASLVKAANKAMIQASEK